MGPTRTTLRRKPQLRPCPFATSTQDQFGNQSPADANCFVSDHDFRSFLWDLQIFIIFYCKQPQLCCAKRSDFPERWLMP
jgi:hypothetical protein